MKFGKHSKTFTEISTSAEPGNNEIITSEKPLVPIEISTSSSISNDTTGTSTASTTSVLPMSNGNYPSVNMSDFRDGKSYILINDCGLKFECTHVRIL